MKMRYVVYSICISAGIIFYGCASTPNEQYEKLVKKELASGKRKDSLFLGISLGMTSKDFYTYCWEQNKKGVLTDGSNNTMVLYKIKAAMRHPVSMNFYPDFYEDKIFHMRVNFQYDAWAPWNKSQYSDTLLTDVLAMYKKWYPGGDEFLKMSDKEKGTIYVKVDGNRRIIVGRHDDMIVKADYTDLLIEEKIKLSQSKK